jgi:hypothetical protein
MTPRAALLDLVDDPNPMALTGASVPGTWETERDYR